MKREGLILDYKVFLNTTKHDPQDWDMASILYKNLAALDGLTAKNHPRQDRIEAGRAATRRKRGDMREIVTTMILREVTLK